MSTQKRRQARGQTAVSETEALEAEEEKLLRMRYGHPGGPDLRVGPRPMTSPRTLAELRDIELRALQHSGRLDQLDNEAAALLGEPQASDIKQKIISQLAVPPKPKA